MAGMEQNVQIASRRIERKPNTESEPTGPIRFMLSFAETIDFAS
jgi:hypothetical protein